MNNTRQAIDDLLVLAAQGGGRAAMDAEYGPVLPIELWHKCLGRADNHFDELVVGEDTAIHKPAPEPYPHAAARLGVEAGRSLVFEDTPNGIAAAKAAGMWCVALPNAMTEPLDLSAADLVVEELGGVTLEGLCELLIKKEKHG